MQKKDLQISTELQKVFDALTFSIPILSIIENDGISTIMLNSDDVIIFDNLGKSMLLQNGMVVTLGLKNYVVSNVVHTPDFDSFDIEETGLSVLTTPNWSIACNFQAGSRIEINAILKQEQADENRFKRFPLVWWIYSDEKDFFNETLDFKSTLNLAFAYKSNSTDRTTKRIDENITKIIQPLLRLFLLWLQSSEFYYMLEFYGYEKPIDYKTTNFPFYGNDNESVLEVSSDAIEIELNLNFKKQYDY